MIREKGEKKSKVRDGLVGKTRKGKSFGGQGKKKWCKVKEGVRGKETEIGTSTEEELTPKKGGNGSSFRDGGDGTVKNLTVCRVRVFQKT